VNDQREGIIKLFEKILVATDFRHDSQEALQVAHPFAKEFFFRDFPFSRGS
jgi:hypothetical protein